MADTAAATLAVPSLMDPDPLFARRSRARVNPTETITGMV